MLGWIRGLFYVCAAYDGTLGLVFFFFQTQVFAFYGVTPPNHPAYVQFPALLLVLFALMFARIAADPLKQRDLILYGIGLKAAYSGLAFWYQLHGGIPSMWLPWAWADLVFLLLFALAWLALGARRTMPVS
jgi:hypothetical protein